MGLDASNFGGVVDQIKKVTTDASKNQAVIDLALKITDGSYDKIASIYHFAQSAITYTEESFTEEEVMSVIEMVNMYNQGQVIDEDCEDFANLVVSLALAIGMKARTVIVSQTPAGGYDHAIAEVWSGPLNRWVQVDASTKNVPLGWNTTFFLYYPIV